MAELYPLASAAPQVKAAVVALLRVAFAADGAVTVAYGDPGGYRTADLVQVTQVEAEQEIAALRVRPSRDERLRVTVVISCWVGGGPEAQQPATERAYTLLAVLADAVRADTSLGGLCLTVQLVEHVMDEMAADDPEHGTQGRVSGIAAVIAAHARI